MQCMKCGRDLETGEVFCTECRETMEQYPVKPGTVVQLPHRVEHSAPKKQSPRRRTVTQEEQLEMLKKLTRRMAVALVAAIMLIAGLSYAVATLYLNNRDRLDPGQNYSAIDTEAPTTEATEAPGTETGLAG